jgi:hypothetical protein
MKKLSLRRQRVAGRVSLPDGAQGIINELASRNCQPKEELTTQKLRELWKAIRSDPDARGAFKRLAKAGFRISHLKPNDATFKHPNWADSIAAVPLVANKASTRSIHSKIRFRKHRPLVQELRLFGAKLNAPFVEITISATSKYPAVAKGTLRDDLLKTATMLDHFLSWDYCIRNLNPRHALIAELRWTIRKNGKTPRS